MKENLKITENLNETKTFFNPHPGSINAIIILPALVKKVADDLNGKKMPLRMAILKIKLAAKGRGEVFIKDSAIVLGIHKQGGITHKFRIISFY